MPARFQPFSVELNHEAAMRTGAILVGMYDFWSPYDHTTGLRVDAIAVNDFERLSGYCQTNGGPIVSVSRNSETRRM